MSVSARTSRDRGTLGPHRRRRITDDRWRPPGSSAAPAMGAASSTARRPAARLAGRRRIGRTAVAEATPDLGRPVVLRAPTSKARHLESRISSAPMATRSACAPILRTRGIDLQPDLYRRDPRQPDRRRLRAARRSTKAASTSKSTSTSTSLRGWQGAAFHTNFYQIHGTGLSRNDIDNLDVVSGIEALPSTRLYELWFEQKLLDGKVGTPRRAARGRYRILREPDRLGLRELDLRLARLHGGEPPYRRPGLSPGDARRAVEARRRPISFSILVGLFNGDPAGPARPQTAISIRSGATARAPNFRVGDAPLLMAEGAYAYNLEPRTIARARHGEARLLSSFRPLRRPAFRRFRGGPWRIRRPRESPGVSEATTASTRLSIRPSTARPRTGPRAPRVFVRVAAGPADRNLVDRLRRWRHRLSRPVQGTAGRYDRPQHGPFADLAERDRRRSGRHCADGPSEAEEIARDDVRGDLPGSGRARLHGAAGPSVYRPSGRRHRQPARSQCRPHQECGRARGPGDGPVLISCTGRCRSITVRR